MSDLSNVETNHIFFFDFPPLFSSLLDQNVLYMLYEIELAPQTWSWRRCGAPESPLPLILQF